MARSLKTVITNFSAGELNPLLATRTDTPAYINGAKQCRNFGSEPYCTKIEKRKEQQHF